MNTFSFRAECQHDVNEFLRHMGCAKIGGKISMNRPDITIPDVEVELQTPADSATLLSFMQAVEDGHVMYQTFRECALKDNPLTRDAR
jgi:hypothetical protein